MSERSSKLHGCWRLVSFETEYRDSGTRTQPWGAAPNGHLIFDPAGRMMVLITAGTREPGNTDEQRVALFHTLLAYTGRYRIEADRFVTRIDSCWNEAWNGTDQERFYTLDGDMLDISTAWMPNPLMPGNPEGRGILRFRRE